MTTDPFELQSEIGRGGMGVVWRARDTHSGQTVAVKLMHEQYAHDPDYVVRLQREVEVQTATDWAFSGRDAWQWRIIASMPDGSQLSSSVCVFRWEAQ